GALRALLHDKLDPTASDGIISMHLIESDPALSRPISGAPSTADPGAGDWFVLIDGTHVEAISLLVADRFHAAGFRSATVISRGVYTLMWDLAKSDLPLAANRT